MVDVQVPMLLCSSTASQPVFMSVSLNASICKVNARWMWCFYDPIVVHSFMQIVFLKPSSISVIYVERVSKILKDFWEHNLNNNDWFHVDKHNPVLYPSIWNSFTYPAWILHRAKPNETQTARKIMAKNEWRESKEVTTKRWEVNNSIKFNHKPSHCRRTRYFKRSACLQVQLQCQSAKTIASKY